MITDPIWRPAEGGLERIAVQGGWIYRDMNGCAGLCFVPAPPGAAALPRPRPVAADGGKAVAA